MENSVFFSIQCHLLTLLTSSSKSPFPSLLWHWTGLKAVLLCCSHGVKLCHVKKHAAAARSSSSGWCYILLFCVVIVLPVYGDIWRCTGQSWVQSADLSRCHIPDLGSITTCSWHTTLSSRPVPKAAPQLLMHPPNLVLRTEVELWLQQPREHFCHLVVWNHCLQQGVSPHHRERASFSNCPSSYATYYFIYLFVWMSIIFLGAWFETGSPTGLKLID